MRPRLQSFADPEGAFLDHDAVLRGIDESLGFVTVEQILDAEQRVQRALAVPRAVELRGLSREVA